MKSDRKIKKLVRRGYWVRIAGICQLCNQGDFKRNRLIPLSAATR